MYELCHRSSCSSFKISSISYIRIMIDSVVWCICTYFSCVKDRLKNLIIYRKIEIRYNSLISMYRRFMNSRSSLTKRNRAAHFIFYDSYFRLITLIQITLLFPSKCVRKSFFCIHVTDLRGHSGTLTLETIFYKSTG